MTAHCEADMNFDESLCTDCENCIYDEVTGSYVCGARLDEDELVSFISSGSRVCKYYRPYDEYKTVRKQN